MATPMPEPRPSIAPKQDIPALQPTHDQATVIYVFLVYCVVIFAMWNLPGVKRILNPFKLMTVGWHELCHIAVAIMTGGRVLSVSIDPNDGGATRVEGGHAPSVLSAGYIGSTVLGAIFILASFDTLVAKIMSFFIAFGLLMPLSLVRDKLTILLTIVYEALLIGFWFISHAAALRWYCLFVGVLHIFYVVWDISDEKFFRKVNDSDCTQFALLFPNTSAHNWAIMWILFEIAFLIAFVLIGISSFKLTTDQMRQQAAVFLPT